MQQRLKIFEELKNKIMKLSISVYGRHVPIKMLKYGNSEMRKYIIEKQIYGNVAKLAANRLGNTVLEYAYNQLATSLQRSNLVREFYGKEFAVMKSDKKESLEEIMKNGNEKNILNFMKGKISKMINKAIFQPTIFHQILREWIENLKSWESKKEAISMLDEVLLNILHTKDGAKVAVECVTFGSAKTRRNIIKSMKSKKPEDKHFVSVCKEQFGHQVILRILDVTDDTVLIKKTIFSELKDHLQELILDPYASKILIHLLTPRNTLFFTQHIINTVLNEATFPEDAGEDAGKSVSKKDAQKRQEELLKLFLPPLLSLLLDNQLKFLVKAELSEEDDKYVNRKKEEIAIITKKPAIELLQSILISDKGKKKKKIADKNLRLFKSFRGG